MFHCVRPFELNLQVLLRSGGSICADEKNVVLLNQQWAVGRYGASGHWPHGNNPRKWFLKQALNPELSFVRLCAGSHQGQLVPQHLKGHGACGLLNEKSTSLDELWSRFSLDELVLRGLALHAFVL